MAEFKHDSEAMDEEPEWGDVDQNQLPLMAFVWEAPGTEEDKVSTWKYPHHWVTDGNLGDGGRFEKGNLHLHRGGLNAAWAMANGARSGEKASKEVMDHLQDHREALGLTEESKDAGQMAPYVVKGTEEPQLSVGGDLESKEDAGVIEGYATVWGVPDIVGDIMTKGTFSRSIRERVAAGKVLLMARHFAHGGGVGEAIGQIMEAKEDDHGLWFRARLFSTALAQDTRRMIKDSAQAFGASVGFKPVKGGRTSIGKGAWQYRDAALYEITVTPYPALEVTSVEAKNGHHREEEDKLQRRLDELEQKVEELSQGKQSPLVPGEESANEHDQNPDGQEKPTQQLPSVADKFRRRLSVFELGT